MNRKKLMDAAIVFIAAVLIILFAAPLLTKWLGVMGGCIAELLLGVIALGAVLIRRRDPKRELSLAFPSIRSFFRAVLLIFAANALQNAASYITVGISGVFPNQGDISYYQSFFADQSPFVALVVLALVPAICEELLFRGYLLNALKIKGKPYVAVLISSFCFAAIHFDLTKFAPLFIMGLAYALIAYKTGSILLPCIFHFLNNALSVISYMDSDIVLMEGISVVLKTSSYLFLGIAMLGVGGIFAYFGVTVLFEKKRRGVYNALVIVAGILVLFGGCFAMVMGEIDHLHTSTIDKTLREDAVYADTFTLDKGRYVMISVNALTGNVGLECTVMNENDVIIYEYPAYANSGLMALDKGEYRITYSFSVNDENAGSQRVLVNTDIFAFAELDIPENFFENPEESIKIEEIVK